MKAEKLLYTALIAFIWYEGDEEEKNLNTLLDLLNESETREEDETYQNPVDMMFQELEERDPQHFAVRQYRGLGLLNNTISPFPAVFPNHRQIEKGTRNP